MRAVFFAMRPLSPVKFPFLALWAPEREVHFSAMEQKCASILIVQKLPRQPKESRIRLDLFRNQCSVDFLVLLSCFSILFAGVVSNFVYYPRKKNRKAAKIIQKINEPLDSKEVY